MRKGCETTWPRGTEPKSRDSSSNMLSALVWAWTWPATANTPKINKLYRSIFSFLIYSPSQSCRLRVPMLPNRVERDMRSLNSMSHTAYEINHGATNFPSPHKLDSL